jgi:hypothetical protein
LPPQGSPERSTMSENEDEFNTVVLPVSAAPDNREIRIRSWRVACGVCRQPCYLASGTRLLVPDPRPLCMRCFERQIGTHRARFYLRASMLAQLGAHNGGRCLPGLCPIIGCPNQPVTVN